MSWDKWKRKFGIGRKRNEVPGGLWMRCPGCNAMVYRKTVEDQMQVCPECKYHFSINSEERLALLLDDDTFSEIDANLQPLDPLQFTDSKPYPQRVAEAQKSSGLKEAIVCGTGDLYGRKIAIGVMDSRFIMASMGSVVGEKITRLAELATRRRLPLILVCASGGARMQEGCISLMQMAKTSAALARHHDAGLLFITVLTHPTTAGVLASFASQGDLIFAEPRALIGFTGPRVIANTIRAELPKGFQTAEYLLAHGFLDRIVLRKNMKDELAKVLAYTGEDFAKGVVEKFKSAESKPESVTSKIKLPSMTAEEKSGSTTPVSTRTGGDTSLIDKEMLEPTDSPIYMQDSQEIRMATAGEVADDFYRQDTERIDVVDDSISDDKKKSDTKKHKKSK